MLDENIVGCVLARNEADRYLGRVIANLREFCDDVLVVDDHSTDGSRQCGREAGAQVIALPTERPMWGQETFARQFCWTKAAEMAKGGWVYFADADHITVGDIRFLAKSWVLNSWAFPLYDVWDPDETTFRADGPWQGHRFPRVWMVRPSGGGPDFVPAWSGRGIHSGHLPANFPLACGVAPTGTHILHLGYATELDRHARYERYLTVKDQLSPFEQAHASTILD